MALSYGIIACLIPPLGLPLGLIGIQRDSKYWRIYIFCLSIAIASIAYAYVPTKGSDLTRYIVNFEEFGKKTFVEAIGYRGATQGGVGEGLFALYVFYWVIGRIGDYHLGAAFTTFVVYYVALYITCDFGIKERVNNNSILRYIVFILLVLNLQAIINNIRNIFAFSLICLAVYRDCYQKKRNLWTILLYIIPLFFHTSTVLFILLRFALFLKGRWTWIVSVLLLCSPTIVNILYSLVSTINSSNYIVSMLVYTIKKAYTFFNDTSSTWGLIVQNSGSQKLARIAYISIAILFCVLIACNFYKSKCKGIYQDNPAMRFNFYSGLLTLSCTQMLTPEYWRFASAMVISGGVSYLSIVKRPIGKAAQLLMSCICLIVPVCTALWVRDLINGSEWIQLLYKPFLSSPLFVLFYNIVR